MKYTIIKNSESNTGYDIPDCEYKGQNGYACGWQFELERDGKVGYSDVKFFNGTAEECAHDNEWYWNLVGCTPTGTVIFRGYYEEHYDWEERDNYYTDVPAEALEGDSDEFADAFPEYEYDEAYYLR